TDIKLQELEDEMLGITGQGTEERTGKTYKITSTVEQQADKYMEKKEDLIRKRSIKEREVKRIENAISVLTEEEREVIELAHIQLKKYWKIENQLHKSYSRLKQIENEAAEKMEKYLS
ncbi:hypothetical protein, partial [Clostridium cadaveris]